MLERALLVLALLPMTLSACASREVDPRSVIHAPNEEYVGRVAQSINGSKFWQAYFAHLAPDPATARPLIAVNLAMERDSTPTHDGDYDPGTVEIHFSVTNLRNGAQLYRHEASTRLDDVIYGLFEENATREDIQKAAFEEAEDDVFPYIHRWVNIAAVRAIGELGAHGRSFTPMLEEQSEDPWAEDLASEARLALKAIHGIP